MFCKTVFIGGVFWALSVPRPAQSAPSFPGPVKAELDQALSMVKVAYTSYETTKLDRAGRGFTELLDRLGDAVDPRLVEQVSPLEGEDIHSKLVTIAVDRKIHREAYEEIEEEYVRKVDNPNARLPQSLPLRVEHQTERYRLVWEYLLLRPPLADAAAFYDGNARNALASIGNPASVVTLLHNYRAAAEGEYELNDGVEARQRLLLGGLSAFRDLRGLKAILECLTLSERQLGRIDNGRRRLAPRWDVAGYVGTLLKTPTWEKVIAGASRGRLNPDERESLERIEKRQRTR